MTTPNTQRPAEMAKAYEPQQVEQRLYDWWEQSGFFTPAADPTKKPFTMSMPPPNVTGELHMGHAMFVTLEDVIARWHRMRGEATLWLPGTDHAGIATQMQVERLLEREGTSRKTVGREEFTRRTWEWKEKYGGEITSQLRRLGASCDWSRERFTLDPGLSRAVRAAFKKLYDDGLIYRGKRLVNWSPKLQTAVSDLEVEYEERQVNIWHIRYPVLPEEPGTEHQEPQRSTEHAGFGAWGSGTWAAETSEYITVATTRPETIMGDVAVAVNPEDSRYKHLIGRFVVLPAIGRAIPIVADEYADPAFGTGAVKITPAHDPNDYLVAQRQNLPMINIMNRDATLNEEAGPYAGQERFAARKNILADLEQEGLLIETRPHTMSVGISQRGGEIIEPLLSEQWFVNVAPMAELALAAVKEGRTKIIPERFEKVYFHWLENIQDWCISRQLWWGHRIPVWYTPDGQMIVPGPDDPEPQGEGIYQDPDVLDTWFSSGLWPFSTLGWPDQTADLEYFYPTDVMETGYDILFFWVARMMMMGCYFTGKEPFHTIYLHGLVRDKDGRKMSKSYGNVVNPLEIMGQYGTDALRFTLATSGTPGQDLNLNPERIESARNFANKLWNITRFVLTKIVTPSPPAPLPVGEGSAAGDRKEPRSQEAAYPPENHRATEPQNQGHSEQGRDAPVERLGSSGPDESWIVTSSCLAHYPYTLADRWIMSRYHRLVGEAERLMASYNFGEAGRQIQDFLWSEFADWYVEVAKIQLDGDSRRQHLTREVLYTVLEGSLRLLHPFMPFVTEEAWQYLTASQNQVQAADGEADQAALEKPASIMLASYPTYDPAIIDEAADRHIELVREIIVGIRNIRNEYRVEPGRYIAATLVGGEQAGLLDQQRALISRLGRIADPQLTVVEGLAEKPRNAAALVVGAVEIYLPLAGLIDLAAERARLMKELEAAAADAGRRAGRLANPGFADKAPAAVVQREREGLAAVQSTVAKLRERINELETSTY
ncbi:MAG: valine--tRNA ligase [Roseiflexaceae bacterium]|nr:valine--tRNA ligase [Roseiflexaceae bacterium]